MDKYLIKYKKDENNPNFSQSNKNSASPSESANKADFNQEKNVKEDHKIQLPPTWKRWKEENPWLEFKNDNAFCSICTQACDKKLINALDSRVLKSNKA